MFTSVSHFEALFVKLFLSGPQNIWIFFFFFFKPKETNLTSLCFPNMSHFQSLLIVTITFQTIYLQLLWLIRYHNTVHTLVYQKAWPHYELPEINLVMATPSHSNIVCQICIGKAICFPFS